jgi:hypothetical protein
MHRYELEDWAWAMIEPLLPPVRTRGRSWRDHRQVINGALGPGPTSWSRFRRRATLSERRRAGRSGTLGGRPGAGSLPRRADRQGPPRLRRSWPAPGCRPHPRQRQRPHRIQSSPGICAGPRAGAGRPRQRPDTVIAGKAYSSREVRRTCGAGRCCVAVKAAPCY